MAVSREDAAQQRLLYDRYFHYVYAIIFRVIRDCGTAEDAEDLLIETFADVMPRLQEIDADHLKAYIGQTARNKALNFCRSQNRHRANTVPLEEAAEPAISHVEETHERKELQEKLLSEIRSLGEPDTTIILQMYWFGARSPQIAKGLGITPSAVRKRANRALGKLRTMLKSRGIEEGTL